MHLGAELLVCQSWKRHRMWRKCLPLNLTKLTYSIDWNHWNVFFFLHLVPRSLRISGHHVWLKQSLCLRSLPASIGFLSYVFIIVVSPYRSDCGKRVHEILINLPYEISFDHVSAFFFLQLLAINNENPCH